MRSYNEATPAEQAEEYKEIADGLRIGRPFKETGKSEYYGGQETLYLENGRWEGFVSLLRTERRFLKAVEVWENYKPE